MVGRIMMQNCFFSATLALFFTAHSKVSEVTVVILAFKTIQVSGCHSQLVPIGIYVIFTASGN
jgi:hypothetical protein